jgi:hypothetical protein
MAAVVVKREVLLGELAAGRGRSVRLRLVEYEKGGVRFDVRQFYVDEAGQSLPTSKGASIKVEDIDKLKSAIAEFEREARGSS